MLYSPENNLIFTNKEWKILDHNKLCSSRLLQVKLHFSSRLMLAIVHKVVSKKYDKNISFQKSAAGSAETSSADGCCKQGFGLYGIIWFYLCHHSELSDQRHPQPCLYLGSLYKL